LQALAKCIVVFIKACLEMMICLTAYLKIKVSERSSAIINSVEIQSIVTVIAVLTFLVGGLIFSFNKLPTEPPVRSKGTRSGLMNK